MNLHLNVALADRYKSNSQAARVITENWVSDNAYCPICGRCKLTQFTNNSPVADFYCDTCNSEFELKSKKSARGVLSPKITDGAYDTMVARITSLNNPHLFVLLYNQNVVSDFLIIPKYFFTPAIIEKRKPLSLTAQRTGWTGCNILISNIPNAGKIAIIKDGIEITVGNVVDEYKKTKIFETENITKRGWLLDVMSCVDRIPSANFTLDQVYYFEQELESKHPENSFIREKIRQQLQLLRDRGFVKFTTRGNYEKL